MNKELYKLKSSVIKSLSNPVRLMIVDYLRSGEKTVNEIVEAIKEDQSNVSKNLGILKSYGIIQDRRIGNNSFYSIKICCADELFCCLDSIVYENLQQQKDLLTLIQTDQIK